MTVTPNRILAALGPLAELYADPHVLEIMVDAPDRVLVERAGHLEQANVHFKSPEALHQIITALLELNEETIHPGTTILPLHFFGSAARGMAILPPTAVQGPCLVIRKLMQTSWITWDKLIEFGSITPEVLDFLRRAVQAPANILMAGGTGAGKTTIANRIAELIAPEQRLVVVENSHEMQIHHPRALYLEAAAHPGVSMPDLIHTGTQMRPDWLIVGELTGPEAMRTIEVFSRGHSGMTTIHANSLEDALLRLEAFCLTAKLGLGLPEIRNLIAAALQLVCYQKRLANGRRKITEIAEIRGVHNGQFILERLFRYNPETEALESTGIKSSWD